MRSEAVTGRASKGHTLVRLPVALVAALACAPLIVAGCRLLAPYQSTVKAIDSGSAAAIDGGPDASPPARRDGAVPGDGQVDAALVDVAHQDSAADASEDAGTQGDGGTATDAAGGGSPSSVIFATSTTYLGNFLGGVPVISPDQECSDRATSAGLSGEFRALLSTPTMEAIDLAGLVRYPVVNVNEVVVEAQNLFDGTGIAAPILMEEGSPRQISTWTGSLPDGHRSANTCDGWTGDSSPLRGTDGLNGLGADWFAHNIGAFCSNHLSFFCIQVGGFAANP